ncbi:hypothetical protein [Paraburkholderia sp. BR13444]|uniref:hypothetical protein n=1 Tax=Paraburkholderia sp. BR13444 TaxID=3236997 RepID=UPI0034CDD333
MIALQISKGSYLAIVTSHDGQKARVRLPRLSIAFGHDAERLAHAFIEHFNKASYRSQISDLTRLNEFCRIASQIGLGRLPDSTDEWQEFLITVFTEWFKREKCSLRTRVSTWRHLGYFLTILRDSKRLIPQGVEIPMCGVNKLRLDDEPSPQLLGQHPLRLAPKEHQKVLMEISLARSDAEYFDEVRGTLSSRRAALNEVATEWLEMIDAHYQYGQKLIASVDYEKEIKPHLNDPSYWRDWSDQGRHKCSGHTEKSLATLLAILHHKIEIGESLTICLFEEKGRYYLPSHPTLDIPPDAPQPVSPLVTKFDRIRWMLGSLTSHDYLFAQLFFTIHHPVFFGSAFSDAKLVSRQGESMISLGTGDPVARLVKGRAHALKQTQLDSESERFLSMIFQMTNRARQYLKKKNPLIANRLVLITKLGKLAVPVLNASAFFRKGTNPGWIGGYFPHIDKLFSGEEITFRKVRATEGVLEWLKTGSLTAATFRLGNSKQIFIEHYIPHELLVSFYARQVRRYHNLFLAAACPTDIDLSDVLEFKTLDEIHDFIKNNLFIEPFKSSPLGQILGKKQQPKTQSFEAHFKDLVLPVSTNSIATLYLYQECALAAGFNNSTLSPHANFRIDEITPDDIIDLAELARFRLPHDKDPKMRIAHSSALEKCKVLRKKYDWSNLMLLAMEH